MSGPDGFANTLASALERFETMLDRPFGWRTEMTVVPDDAFWAIVHQKGDGYQIAVTRGVADALTALWNDAFEHRSSPSDGLPSLLTDPALAVRISLGWLMHHEMEHIEMGHLKIAAGHGLAETSHPHARALLERLPAPKVSPMRWASTSATSRRSAAAWN